MEEVFCDFVYLMFWGNVLDKIIVEEGGLV